MTAVDLNTWRRPNGGRPIRRLVDGCDYPQAERGAMIPKPIGGKDLWPKCRGRGQGTALQCEGLELIANVGYLGTAISLRARPSLLAMPTVRVTEQADDHHHG